ncbi:MAG: DUF4838 domain-containing protein [Verrucomicrobia bacterium]|nr:DUF4838 domain-containing protein [Verrucomicrobiota bacterium]
MNKFLQFDVWHPAVAGWLFASMHSRGWLCHMFLTVLLICASLSACKNDHAGADTKGNTVGKKSEMLLLANGDQSPEVRIVVAEGALETPREAAVELQRLVEKATGRKWPISNSIGGEGIHVVVGPHPAAAEAGLRVEDLPPEGFRLRVKGRYIFLVGRDTKGSPWDLHWRRACQTGTLFAVVEFAREFLEARWVMPGNDGEVVAKLSKLEVPAGLDVQGAPRFLSRRITVDNTQRDGARWMRFNRLGWSQITAFGHNWYQTISPDKYGKEHPEWFALVDGVRQTHMRNGEYGGQLCTSNPEVVKKMAECAVENYKEIPEAFSLAENDGGSHCECLNCRALDVEEWHPGKPALADRLAVFANRVKETIGDRAPGMVLGYYGYHQGELPPVKTKLAPGIILGDVHNSYDLFYHQKEARAYQLRILKGWREQCAQVHLITYFHGMTWWSLPFSATDALTELIKTAAQYSSSQGVYLGMTYRHDAFGTQGNEYYLAAALMWDPRRSTESVLTEYYQAAYGPAAAPIKEYFEMIGKNYGAWARAQTKVAADECHDDSWVVPTYELIRRRCDELIQKAAAAAGGGDAALQKRVKIVAEGWEWTKFQTDTIKGIEEFKKDHSKENARRMLDILKRRQAFCEAHAAADNYAISVPEIKMTDEGRAFPIAPGEYEAVVSGAVKAIHVPLVQTAGNPEANLDALPWDKATVSDPFVKTLDGSACEIQTVARIMADERNLYVWIEAQEPHLDKLVHLVKQPDGDVWTDDVVEVFLDPTRLRKKYYHLLINPDGVMADFAHTGETTDRAWSSNCKVAAAQSKDRWSIKLSVPYGSMGLKGPPLPGDVWSVNFARSRHAADPEVNLAWSPTFGGFLKPQRFGELVFEVSGKGN